MGSRSKGPRSNNRGKFWQGARFFSRIVGGKNPSNAAGACYSCCCASPKPFPNPRRADLHLLLALLLLGAALAALLPSVFRSPAAEAPPRLAAGPAVYRPDGGQALGPGGRLRPNDLTGLNLGRQIHLNRAHPEQLAQLPGLGPKSAVKARAGGCLTRRQRPKLTGLVIEECDPNSP